MKIHHIGYVVEDIEKYKKSLLCDKEVKRVIDDFQKAELVLFECDNIYIELVRPLSEDSFTYNFLKKGGGFHHICYETSKNKAEELIKQKRMIKVLNWVYAPLLDSEVCFAYNKNKELLEFVCEK